jgi:hypothetical protein
VLQRELRPGTWRDRLHLCLGTRADAAGSGPGATTCGAPRALVSTARERGGPMKTHTVRVASEVADGSAEAIAAQVAAIQARGDTVVSVQVLSSLAAMITYTEGRRCPLAIDRGV